MGVAPTWALYKNRSLDDTYELCKMFIRILVYKNKSVFCSSRFYGFVFEATL